MFCLFDFFFNFRNAKWKQYSQCGILVYGWDILLEYSNWKSDNPTSDWRYHIRAFSYFVVFCRLQNQQWRWWIIMLIWWALRTTIVMHRIMNAGNGIHTLSHTFVRWNMSNLRHTFGHTFVHNILHNPMCSKYSSKIYGLQCSENIFFFNIKICIMEYQKYWNLHYRHLWHPNRVDCLFRIFEYFHGYHLDN